MGIDSVGQVWLSGRPGTSPLYRRSVHVQLPGTVAPYTCHGCSPEKRQLPQSLRPASRTVAAPCAVLPSCHSSLLLLLLPSCPASFSHSPGLCDGAHRQPRAGPPGVPRRAGGLPTVRALGLALDSSAGRKWCTHVRHALRGLATCAGWQPGRLTPTSMCEAYLRIPLPISRTSCLPHARRHCS